MTSYQEIATVSRSLICLLLNARDGTDFQAARCELYQAQSFKSPMEEGVSLYLFRVAVSRSRRANPEFSAAGERLRPPVFVDVSYLLSAWARQAERQQHLLAWAIRTFEDHAVLPGRYLNSCATEGDPFRADETVEISPEPLPLADLVNVWEVAKTNPQPSAGYVVRTVPIRSTLSEEEAERVRVREPWVGPRVAS